MWEYKIIKLHPVNLDAEYQLDQLGRQGWELVLVSYTTAYLKRPIQVK